MAILKHIASKNADYGEPQRYLLFQHDEFTGKPILDNNGKMMLREEYYMDGINCDPFTFDTECKELNNQYRKNQNYNDIKTHHYIISFDPKDCEDNGLTGERAQKLGLEYAKQNFPGHQALVCTHTDGSNKSGNIHVHIVINSLRKFDVAHQVFMERPCDSRAGNKHHLTNNYLNYLKQSVMDMCQQEKLHQVDLLSPAKKKITEQEYQASRRGQKQMDESNKVMQVDNVIPRQTTFQTQKEYLRLSIEEAAASACSLEEFQKILLEQFSITLKISRGRISYLHPERAKPITGKNLGTQYEKSHLLNLFRENAARPENQIFMKADLRLIIDLQQCMKAQQSKAYARKVKLSNLKEMARTVAYIQEHGFDTLESLDAALVKAKGDTAALRKELKDTSNALRDINEQIHYTGQYLAHKSIYSQFCQSKNKGKFQQEHSTELTLYKTALKYLKDKSGNDKLPSMKILKAKKQDLLKLQHEQQERYHNCRGIQKELSTVSSNIHTILGASQIHSAQKQKRPDIS